MLQVENEAKNEQVYEQQRPNLDAKELKENIQACEGIRDEAHGEDIQAYEHEEEALEIQDYGFRNELEMVNQQYGLLYQLEFCHSFQDPVATYMETIFPGTLNILTLSLQTNYSSRYKFLLEYCL